MIYYYMEHTTNEDEDENESADADEDETNENDDESEDNEHENYLVLKTSEITKSNPSKELQQSGYGKSKIHFKIND